MYRGNWQATVHGFTKSHTQLSTMNTFTIFSPFTQLSLVFTLHLSTYSFYHSPHYFVKQQDVWFVFFFFSFKKQLYLLLLAVLGIFCWAGFSLAVESGSYSPAVTSHCGGFSSCRAHTLWCMGSAAGAPGLQSTGSVVMVHRLRCSKACEVFPGQECNLCLTAMAGRFLTTKSPGRPYFFFFFSLWPPHNPTSVIVSTQQMFVLCIHSWEKNNNYTSLGKMSSLWGGIGNLHPYSYSLSYLLYTNLSSQVKNNLLELIYSNSIQFYTIFDTTLWQKVKKN